MENKVTEKENKVYKILLTLSNVIKVSLKFI